MSIAAEPIDDALNELIGLAHEGAQTHAAAAERVRDGELRQLLVMAVQSHRETVSLLAEEVQAHGEHSADESAVRHLSAAAKAALAGAAANHLDDAANAEMARSFELQMADLCARVSQRSDLRPELRRAVQWAGDKAEVRARALERRALALAE